MSFLSPYILRYKGILRYVGKWIYVYIRHILPCSWGLWSKSPWVVEVSVRSDVKVSYTVTAALATTQHTMKVWVPSIMTVFWEQAQKGILIISIQLKYARVGSHRVNVVILSWMVKLLKEETVLPYLQIMGVSGSSERGYLIPGVCQEEVMKIAWCLEDEFHSPAVERITVNVRQYRFLVAWFNK